VALPTHITFEATLLSIPRLLLIEGRAHQPRSLANATTLASIGKLITQMNYFLKLF